MNELLKDHGIPHLISQIQNQGASVDPELTRSTLKEVWGADHQKIDAAVVQWTNANVPAEWMPDIRHIAQIPLGRVLLKNLMDRSVGDQPITDSGMGNTIGDINSVRDEMLKLSQSEAGRSQLHPDFKATRMRIIQLANQLERLRSRR
jgi:hypothetical protein